MDLEISNKFVEQFQELSNNEEEFTKKCAQLANDVQLGTTTILQLVEQLKVFLIDDLTKNRELGMVILSNVLKGLSSDLLTAAQLKYICTFHADRLNDRHQVIPPTLIGVLRLLSFENLPDGSTKEMLNSLFNNVACQQQQQLDRFNIYKIIETAFKNKKNELLSMNFDFVYGVISAMDGERDPRNLLFLFNWLPTFLKSVALEHLSEEMFEVMACYFPIDFRTSHDSNNITRETLAESLCKCLCAIPEFAEFCLPLALEKLSSSLLIAKLDSLNILIEGCKSFDVAKYIQHSTDIWSQIQREVLNCDNTEVEKTALKSLEVVITKLSQSPENVFQSILSDITDTVKGNLMPNLKLFTPSCKILKHTAKGSKASARYITIEVMPIFKNTYKITETPSHQVVVFKNIIDFTKIYIDVNHNDDITDVQELSLVPNLCLQAIIQKEEELQAIGFWGISIIPKSLTFEQRNCLYDNFSVLLINPTPVIVRAAVLKCFKIISQIYVTELHQHVLNKINITSNATLILYFDALRNIADQEEFTTYVLATFVKSCIQNIDTSEIAVDNLKKLLESCNNNPSIYNYLMEQEQVIYKLIDWIISSLDIIDVNINRHETLLENISLICKLLIEKENANNQNAIINAKMDNVIGLYKKNNNPVLMVVLDGLLTSLHQEVEIKYDIVDYLLDISLKSKAKFLQSTSLQLLANLINKAPNDTNLQKKLDHILLTCNNSLNNSEQSDMVNNTINSISWIAKALIMRGYADTEIWTNRLLLLLENHSEAAKGFRIILKENYRSLSRDSHCNIRVLYRQKFFIDMTNKLIEIYKSEHTNYLLAIGYLLEEAPKQIFIMQFSKIIRLISLCLEKCLDSEVICSILDKLYELIEGKEPLMEQYLQEFLTKFTKLANYGTTMQIRITALQCIQKYTNGFELYKLLPFKQDIIKDLSPCLDDKKRLVRKVAVETRLSWIMLDAPT